MSADMWLLAAVDAGGEEEIEHELWHGNMTYNLSPMWHEAGWTFKEIEGKSASELLPVAKAALTALTTEPDKYRAMNPANGWGDYEGCVEFFTELVDCCKRFPKAKAYTWL